MPSNKIQNTMEYSGFRILLACFKILPVPLQKKVLRSLFTTFGYGLGIRRKVASLQLRKVYPKWDDSQIKKVLKGVYRNMADSAFEVYLLDDKTLLDNCNFIGYEHMEEALGLGRGVILATAHFGSWESARVMPMKGVPLCVVTKRQRNQMFDDYTNGIRKRNGLLVIDMKRGLRDIINHLKENKVVAILMDQNAGGSGLPIDFLGFPAAHWKGVAKLSLRYKIPIVPGFAPRYDDGKIDFMFYPMILHEELDDLEDHYPVILRELDEILESLIRQYPEQWFWVHKRWKETYDMFAVEPEKPVN